jgi:hypothetical protein
MFAAYKRRPVETEDLVRVGDERMDVLWDEIRACKD